MAGSSSALSAGNRGDDPATYTAGELPALSLCSLQANLLLASSPSTACLGWRRVSSSVGQFFVSAFPVRPAAGRG